MLVMRDLLARRSEAAALTVEDLTFAEDGSATALIARSKTDREGAGAVRWLSPRTAAALRPWLDCARIASGPCSVRSARTAWRSNQHSKQERLLAF